MDGINTKEGKIGSLILRIWFPLFVFGIFMFLLLGKDELYSRFLRNLSGVGRVIFEYGSQIGVWVSGALLAQRFITVFVWDGLIAGISGRPVPRLPKDFTGILMFGIAFMGVLATVFNQSITGIWATSGVFGIILGVALRNVILDVFIGLSMHVEQPFRIGDWVMIHQNRRETHIVGQVIEINWRTTRLKNTEKNMIVVPNSKMGEAILTNYMKPKPYFRIDLEFVLDYEVPPNRAIRLLLAAVKSMIDSTRILNNPEPEVRLDAALSYGQKYEVRFFILPTGVSPKESKHLVNRRVIEHLLKVGIKPAIEKEIVYMERDSLPQPKRKDNGPDYNSIIRSNSLFSTLPEDEINHLEGYFTSREIFAGEKLYRQENEGESLFILIEGLLKSNASLDGSKDIDDVESIEPGQHFGEECVLGPNLRASTVVAVTDCQVIEISAKKVLELANRNGLFLSKLNTETGVSSLKAIQSRYKLKRRTKHEDSKKSDKKKTVGSAIQTFFTDLFPTATTPKK